PPAARRPPPPAARRRPPPAARRPPPRPRPPQLRSAEADRRIRLRERLRAIQAVRQVVRIARGLDEIEHRRQAGVALVGDPGPVVARAGGEALLEFPRRFRPGRGFVLLARVDLAREPGDVEQLAIELRFERADRDET